MEIVSSNVCHKLGSLPVLGWLYSTVQRDVHLSKHSCIIRRGLKSPDISNTGNLVSPLDVHSLIRLTHTPFSSKIFTLKYHHNVNLMSFCLFYGSQTDDREVWVKLLSSYLERSTSQESNTLTRFSNNFQRHCLKCDKFESM